MWIDVNGICISCLAIPLFSQCLLVVFLFIRVNRFCYSPASVPFWQSFCSDVVHYKYLPLEARKKSVFLDYRTMCERFSLFNVFSFYLLPFRLFSNVQIVVHFSVSSCERLHVCNMGCFFILYTILIESTCARLTDYRQM